MPSAAQFGKTWLRLDLAHLRARTAGMTADEFLDLMDEAEFHGLDDQAFTSLFYRLRDLAKERKQPGHNGAEHASAPPPDADPKAERKDAPAGDDSNSEKALPGFIPADLDNAPTPSAYDVKRIIGRGEIGVLFGDSGTLKTFYALDMLLHVASGMEFCGHRVVKTGVVIIAGEGGAGMKKRVRAWELNHAQGGNRPALFVATMPADLMYDGGTIRATIAHAEKVLGVPVGIVCFDTLAASFGDGDENTTADMNRVLRTARETCGDRTILFVHHVGHADKGRERGAYALRGNVDFRIQIERPDNGRIVTVTSRKQKDGEPFATMHFEWRQVDTGWRDIDGDPITSVVLDPTDKAPAPAEPVGKVQKLILEALRVEPLAKSEIAKRLEVAGHSRQSAYRAIRALIDAGVVNEGMHKLSVVTQL